MLKMINETVSDLLETTTQKITQEKTLKDNGIIERFGSTKKVVGKY